MGLAGGNEVISMWRISLWYFLATERLFFKELEKNPYDSRFRISYYVCQLKGNNSQVMYLTLLYCEKPMLLNLICWLVKINEFYYSPSFIYIIFSATKHKTTNWWKSWHPMRKLYSTGKVKNWRHMYFICFL